MSPNNSSPQASAPQDKCDPLNADNLSPNFQEFLSLLKDDDVDNARDDDNVVASSGDDVLDPEDKGYAKAGGNSATTSPESTPEASPDEIGGSPPVAPPAAPADTTDKRDVALSYNVLQYDYAHRHAPTTADFTTALNSTTGTGKRCFRLNLERPFDIHCEQSPLEYGDYMAPWSKEVQPPTVGPTEYCPPRHLGGEEAVWRELMRWSHGSAGAGRDQEGDAGAGEDAGVESNYAAGIGGSGWRKLKPTEFLAVKKLRERTAGGELAFQAYDLSHVVPTRAGLAAHDAAAGGAAGFADPSVHTIFSVDSNTSAEERLHRKSPEERADATARLFRRSETTLNEAAAEEEAARARQAQQEAEEKRLEKERKKLERGGKRSFNPRKSLKKMANRLSGSMNQSQTSGSLRGSAVRKTNAAFVMRCSVQASQIDKARDMVDGYDDGDGGLILTPGDGQPAGEANAVATKKLNISLFVVGEYDILNDLVNNGAKRLSSSLDAADLDLLLQNEPCPSPDRWVRSTGWGRCNPSSNYARTPPEDFDWEKYDDKLWLKTDDPKKAEALLDASGLYARRSYAKVQADEEEEEDSLSQSQRVRRSRPRRTAGAAGRGARGAPAAAPPQEEEDALSQSQRVRRSRRRGSTKH